MAGNGNDDRALSTRGLVLLVPVGVAVTVVWIAAGIRAVLLGDPEAFVIATAPFGALCGFLFGAGFLRGAKDG